MIIIFFWLVKKVKQKDFFVQGIVIFLWLKITLLLFESEKIHWIVYFDTKSALYLSFMI